METTFKSNCLLCGSPLVYHTDPRIYRCELCKGHFESEAACEHGHFICNTCHAGSANELIEKICISSNSTRPLETAISLMHAPSVSMHGPEHHFLVPAVLLMAYYNQTGQPQEKEQKIKVARHRAQHVLGGFCGFYGACGAGIGTGIFISLVTDSTPTSTVTWGLANQMTAESLRCIGLLGGPRCCKRDTFMALKTTKKFVKQNFQVSLDIPDTITCEFSDFNKECQQGSCPFHARERT